MNMIKKDIKIKINTILWEKALKKIEMDFGAKYTKTNCLMILMLLALYKKNSRLRRRDNIYLAIEHPTHLSPSAYITMTIAVYDGLLALLQEVHPNFSYSEILESAIADYLVLPISFYTDELSPLYTIVCSKNHTMQKATASAVDSMILSHSSLALIDGCCGTGALFFGLKTYPWKSVILNDLNPLRTNFLSVIQNEPLKLIKKLLETDLTFINQPETKNPTLSAYKKNLENYAQKRNTYSKVDCNADIAYQMFLTQCIDKAMIEQADKILLRITRFLPAHLKLQETVITQTNCVNYLKNDNADKLLLLDVPYISSEHTCGIKGFNYAPFHQKVSEYLQKAEYPFLYFCRSTPPKSDTTFSKSDAEHVMKMKLAQLFFDKGFYFEKVELAKDTELMVSNKYYDHIRQSMWENFEQNFS